MKEDIIRMAREAGFVVDEKAQQHQPNCIFHTHHMVDELLERFAALVATAERDKYEAKFKQLEAIMQEREQQPNKPCCLAEREACAKVCETIAHEEIGMAYEGIALDCAAAIKARSNP